MYCPECLSEVDNYKACVNCSSDLAILKPLIVTSRTYFAQAYLSSKKKKYDVALEQVQLGLSTYPYLPEELRFTIILLLFIGEFGKAIECLKIISALNVPHEDLEELIYQVINRYNGILSHVKQKQYSFVLKEYTNQLESLSLKELELLRISAEQSKHPSINQITSIINQRNLPSSSIKSIPGRINKIMAVATVVIVLVMGFLVFQLIRSNSDQNILIENLSQHLDSLNIEKVQLETQIVGSERETQLLTKLYDAIFRRKYDSVWTIFSELKSLNSSWINSNHQELRPTAQYFYFIGRLNYLEGKYDLGAKYFNRSYNLSSDFWFSDDALYYAGLCYKLLNDDQQTIQFNKLVENHRTSVYWDDSIVHLFDYYLSRDTDHAVRLLNRLDNHQKDSPFLNRLKKRWRNYER